jgi:thioredoxin 1
MPPENAAPHLSRAEVDSMRGPVLLEFGSAWCGFCRAAQAPIAGATAARPRLRHLKVEDGPGLALGRSFRVKLWPTLVFLNDGVEVARLVRPRAEGEIAAALDSIHPVP